MVMLKYIGSDTSPDAGVLWGFDVVRGGTIEVSPDHPDCAHLASHPWFVRVDRADAHSVDAAEADAGLAGMDAFAADESVGRQKRRRRTKAEMAAARDAEA